MASRLEFHISYKCNNNCIFCSESEQLEKFKDQFVAFNEIKNVLNKKRKLGYNHLTLTGGEPSFHPDFINIIKIAKRFGYKVYVSSNGGRFSEKKFWQESSLYIDEICFSLHGHNAKLHNFHTRNNSSFINLTKALDNYRQDKKKIFLFFNIVVTQYNFGLLEKIILLTSSFGVEQILLSNVAPEGGGEVNFKKLAVPLKFFLKKIPELIKLAKKKNIIIRFFGLPFCVFGENIEAANDYWWSPRLTIEKYRDRLKETISLKPTRKRVKTERCNLCARKKKCGGLFKKYFQEFGDTELIRFKV